MPFFTPFFISDLLLDTKTISPHRRFVNFYFSYRALLPEKWHNSTLPKSPQSASLLLKCNITPLSEHAGIYKNTINATFPLPHVFPRYYIECVTTLKCNITPSLRALDFGVCAPQSTSFALATTRLPDGLLNASRPYCSNMRHYFTWSNIVRKRGKTRLTS